MCGRSLAMMWRASRLNADMVPRSSLYLTFAEVVKYKLMVSLHNQTVQRKFVDPNIRRPNRQ
jgi:hypothetical protein